MIHLQLINRANHLKALEAVVRACADYSLQVDGELPTDAEINELFDDVPPEYPVEALVPFGVFDDAAMVGMLWLVRGYPESDTAFIPLFLVVPDHRGRGAGRAAVAQAEAWAASVGYRRIKLVALHANEGAMHFWPRVGYRATPQYLPAKQFKQKCHERTEFEKTL
jgi:GNAT superfamily N-acetyltransferase